MRGKARKRRVVSIVFTIIAGSGLIVSADAGAQQLTVYGGPISDVTASPLYEVTRFIPPLSVSFAGLSPSSAGSGVGIGQENKYVNGNNGGERAVRWDTSSTAIELGSLGTDGSGSTLLQATAINSAGTIAGWAEKYISGNNEGVRAVRWNSSGTATELGNLGTSQSGFTYSFANAINSAGVAAGFSSKYVAGNYLGDFPVRWNASGTTATELGNLGPGDQGLVSGTAYAINDSGTAVGYLSLSPSPGGAVAVRWDGSGTLATRLGNISTDPFGNADSRPLAINNSNTAVGYAAKLDGDTVIGYRAVRWDGSGTAATELGDLGSDINNVTHSYALAINDSGVTVGSAEKYVAGAIKGTRAVRWDASNTIATELGNLGTTSTGQTDSAAYAINSSGIAVGYADITTDLSSLPHAVMWGADGVAIDLNTLIDPASGWLLKEADSISNDNWVTGIGSYASDGSDPLYGYDRLFMIHVPEPTAMSLLFIGTMILSTPRRKGRYSTTDQRRSFQI